MTRPDLLTARWKRMAWFLLGNLSGITVAVAAGWTSAFTSCCAAASPQPIVVQPCVMPPEVEPLSQPKAGSLAERLDRINRKLDCVECPNVVPTEGPR
jgi:hypothetical protein